MILPRSLVVSLAALVLLPCVEVVQGAWIEARCSACRAVAVSLPLAGNGLVCGLLKTMQ